MAVDELKEWWAGVLLGQQHSAHPVFGCDVEAKVDGNVVTLTGTVDSEDQALQLQSEARHVPGVETVISHLRIGGFAELRHRQTVLAVFKDESTAELAAQAVKAAKLHGGLLPHILRDTPLAHEFLAGCGERAQVPPERIQQFLDALAAGQTVLADRVPEDDALRVISVLEGLATETVQTLPPEPETVEMR